MFFSNTDLLPMFVPHRQVDHALPGCSGELQNPHFHLRPLHPDHRFTLEPLLQQYLYILPSSSRLRRSES